MIKNQLSKAVTVLSLTLLTFILYCGPAHSARTNVTLYKSFTNTPPSESLRIVSMPEMFIGSMNNERVIGNDINEVITVPGDYTVDVDMWVYYGNRKKHTTKSIKISEKKNKTIIICYDTIPEKYDFTPYILIREINFQSNRDFVVSECQNNRN